jgi:hypothetical protein
MTPEELNLLQQVSILLSENKKETAYNLVSGLRQKYPNDAQLLIWLAYAAPSLLEAQKAIHQSQILSPENPALANAKNWLRGESQKHFHSTRRPHNAELIVVLAEFAPNHLGYVYCSTEMLYLIEPKAKGLTEIISYKDVTFSKYNPSGFTAQQELHFAQRKKLVFNVPVEEASVLSGFINLKMKSNSHANFGVNAIRQNHLPTINSEVGVKLKYLDKLENYDELLAHLKKNLPKWNISKSLYTGAVTLIKLRILIREANSRQYPVNLLYTYSKDADSTAEYLWSVADRLATFTVVGVNQKALESELKPLQKDVENRTEVTKQTYLALSKMLLKEANQISTKQWFDKEL